jgi:tetratricopeptide (TPR) repeat protein
VASPHDETVSLEETVEVDVSIGEETETFEERKAPAFELGPPEGSEEMATTVRDSGSQTLEEELQEAKFFMQQGMVQEARAIFQRILLHDPEHRLAKQHLAEIERLAIVPSNEESPPADVKKPSVFRVADASPSQGRFVDLGGELNEELGEGESPFPTDLEPEVQHLLHQLDQGIRDQVDVTDYETHYNLGLAYKDLELYEKAIEEFRLAGNDASYRVPCASLMGLCCGR